MGGTMRVESQPGVGSTFSFSMKVPAMAETINYQTDGLPYTLHGKRLLLVDDNATNLRILQHLAKLWLAETAIATNATDALQAAQHQHFDLVILDMLMPDMDGIETAKLLRKMEPFGQTPIILFSRQEACLFKWAKTANCLQQL